MSLRFYAAAVLAASSLLTSPASAAVNYVTNGSFESGSNPGNAWITLGTGSSALNGWAISGSIDYIGDYWVASNGKRSVDMNGSASAGTISQIISGLTSGATYKVAFDISGNPDGPPPVKSLDVSVDGNVTSFSFPGGNTKTAMGWVSHNFTFVAGGTTALLSFGPANDPRGSFGPALDNVSVTAAVPEPSTWAMMLIGFFGLGALSMRRRRTILV